jgi:uncharacterized protein (DUF433 family)
MFVLGPVPRMAWPFVCLPPGLVPRICPGGLVIRRYDRAMAGFARITTDPDRMAGVPCIRGLRFPVASVVTMVADGMTEDEILAEHPDLEREDIREALRFAALAVQERQLPLQRPA